MAKVGARVHIFGDYDGTGVKSAQRDIGAFGQQAEGFSKSFSKSMLGAGAALGGAFAVTAVAGNVLQFFGDSMAAALADEKAMRSLEIALQNVGAAHQVGPIEATIDALARESGVADDQLRPAFQSLVTATSDVALSQKSLQLAMDISAGTGRDLEAVSLALAKGFSGSTTALGKLGAGIDANIIKSKDMDAITAALSAKFAGQAAAAADTYQGKINRLNVAVEEGKELIGTALLKAVDDISEAFGGAGGMAGAVDTAAQAMADFITGTAITVSGLDDLVSGITGATGGMVTYSNATLTALKLAPGIGGLVKVAEDLVNMGTLQRIAAEQQAAANKVLSDRLYGLAAAYRDATGAAAGFGKYQKAPDGKDWANFYAVNQSGSKALANAQNAVNELTAEYNASLVSTSTAASGAAKETYTFKEALAAVNESGLQQLNDNLKKAQEAFDGFRGSISGSISGQLDFAGAADEAKKGGTSIVGGIVSQAAGITAFGEQLKLLLGTSLSQESFTAVAALSAERGSALATELLGANGATLIEQLNTSVAAVGAVAEAVGLQAAEKWYGTGVKIAQDSITGFQDFMGKDGLGRKQLMGTMDRLADAAARQVRIDVMVTRSINEIVTRITQNITGPQARAEGGPVIAGRSYVVGEVGPELFTPSTSGNITPNSAMGGNTYQITVQAGVGDPRAIGQQIVEYVKRFEKANGPVFVAA